MQQLYKELLEGDENIQSENRALRRLVITLKDDYNDPDLDEAMEAREREHKGWTSELRSGKSSRDGHNRLSDKSDGGPERSQARNI